MTLFSALIAGVRPDGLAFEAEVTEDWMQGRTTYGGLSAALCVEAALRFVTGLPPLRTAQFTFIGPAAGRVRMTPVLLRQGKSASFIGVDLEGEQGLATRAVLGFGAARPSGYAFSRHPTPAAKPPEESPRFFDDARAPTFAHHFDYLNAGGALPVSGAADPELLMWLRHKDEAVGASLPALVALTDAPPPAAITLFKAPAPISTMTWLLDVLTDTLPVQREWRLVRSRSEAVADGYSTQEISVWSAAGEPLIIARQNVAVFA